jgi:transcriptional regulator GlxA family with amidase domain
MMQVAVLLFDDFETLDVFGPVELFGRLKDYYQISFYSLDGGLVKNNHGLSVLSEPLDNMKEEPGIFFIPGGYGTRKEVEHVQLLDNIRAISAKAQFVLTVCTGSGLLAKTGLLDGKSATSNKRAFAWASSQGLKVNWIKKARWTVDGNYYTSAGVSAGMDMVLGFLQDRHGTAFARKLAFEIEYNWQENKDEDQFWDQ